MNYQVYKSNCPPNILKVPFCYLMLPNYLSRSLRFLQFFCVMLFISANNPYLGGPNVTCPAYSHIPGRLDNGFLGNVDRKPNNTKKGRIFLWVRYYLCWQLYNIFLCVLLELKLGFISLFLAQSRIINPHIPKIP